MSEEFSLLQHLGVSVEKCEPASAVQSSSVSNAPLKDAFRVWSPARHPPLNQKVPSEHARDVLDKKRKGPQKSYADPTGEVLVRNKHGTEVQYVVYDSKVPSIYGINKQLAERKRAEKAGEKDANTVANDNLALGQDEARQEKERRHILRELLMCKQEQAHRKKEEERLARERRIEQEKAQLRYRDAEAARSEEEARIHKTQREDELRKAAIEAAVAKKQAAIPAENDYGIPAWNGTNEDEERRRAAQRRAREFAQANQRAAEQQRAERVARVAAERERARLEWAEVEQQMREEQMDKAAKQHQMAERLRLSQEADRERRLTASAARKGASPDQMGSLFDFAEQRESQAVQQAQQRLREDMAINARLAEEKRTQAKEERERERRDAAEVADANFADLQREVAQSWLRRLQAQKEMQKTAEVAAVAAREKRKQEALVNRSQLGDALFFWPCDDSFRAEEAKTEAQRRYHNDVRRDAERKRAERAREAEAEKAWERALVEYDKKVAEETAARERREASEKMTQLRRTLERQIASKQQQQMQEHAHASKQELLRVPAPDVESLYRCPVTGELLPSRAYDFGIYKGR